MRNILLILGDANNKHTLAALMPHHFELAQVETVDSVAVIPYLQTHVNPDLIIYAPDVPIGSVCDRFIAIRSLSGNARILVYGRFEKNSANLFDYLAAGASGLLSTGSCKADFAQALNTIMRGDAYVDRRAKAQMLLNRWVRSPLV